MDISSVCSQHSFQSEPFKPKSDLSLFCAKPSNSFSSHSKKSQRSYCDLKGLMMVLCELIATLPWFHLLPLHVFSSSSHIVSWLILESAGIILELAICSSWNAFPPGFYLLYSLLITEAINCHISKITAVSHFLDLFFFLALIILFIPSIHLVYYLLLLVQKESSMRTESFGCFGHCCFPVFGIVPVTQSALNKFLLKENGWMIFILLTDNSHFIFQIYFMEEGEVFKFCCTYLENFLIFKMHFSKIWQKRVFRKSYIFL